MSEPTTFAKAGRREWVGLAIIALPCLLYSMDLTVLHLAVPALSADLEPSASELLWIIDIYGFLVAGFLVTMGTLGDRIGRRRLLFIGAGAFGIASVLAAFAPSAELLIGARAVLGLAGATVAPSTLSLIRNMFHDDQQRKFAISVWITSYSIGGAIAPLIGGMLLEHFWWGSVFLIAVPVMILLLVVGPKLLPEYRDPNAGRPDLFSAALSLAALLSVIYGLKRMAQDGFGAVSVLSVVTGIAIGVWFVKRQLVLEDPLIELRLFALPGFSACLATYGLSILVLFGGFLFLPQYLQLVRGLSAFDAGLWTLPWAISFVVGSMVTPLVAERVRLSHLLPAGLATSALGFALFTRLDANTSFFTFALGSTIFSLALAPVFMLTTDLVVGSAPPERAGAAGAISETSAELGGALGIALFGSIGVAVYRTSLNEAVPTSLDPAASEAARSTLAAAIALGSELSDGVGARLTQAAQFAFLEGVRLCAWISTSGALVLAVFAWLTLRKHGQAVQVIGDSVSAASNP